MALIRVTVTDAVSTTPDGVVILTSAAVKVAASIGSLNTTWSEETGRFTSPAGVIDCSSGGAESSTAETSVTLSVR